MKELRFGNLAFDETFLRARRDSGEEIRFTRSERALLETFTRHVGQVLSRSRLLDAIAHVGSDASDRNIDFLINRLRGKLGDSTRERAWIATQYGEGYVWIAKTATELPDDAFVLIGPVFGHSQASSTEAAHDFLDQLQHALDELTAADQAIVVAPRWRPGDALPRHVRFSLDVSFHADERGLHCAAVLRDGASRHIVQNRRLLLGDAAVSQSQATETAAAFKTAIWQRLSLVPESLAGPTDEPLGVRMQSAATLLTRSPQSWLESEALLKRARADDPANPQTAVMWATHLYNRLLLSGVHGALTADERTAMESEIEALVFDNLAAVQHDPVMVLSAAKLLFFIDRGHMDFAEALAEQAFAASTAFAAAFPVLGQIRMFRGRITEALELFDRSIEMAEPHSEFHVFLMVVKCFALLAANERATLDATRTQLYTIRPIIRAQLGHYWAAPEENIVADLQRFDAAQIRNGVVYLHYVHARRFRQPVHRENVMRGFIAHATQRFGPTIVPDDIWPSVPGLTLDSSRQRA